MTSTTKTYLTRQQIFDAAHLQAQKKTRCIQNKVCLYSDQQGNKCFIGALIPDELYKTSLENRPGSDVLVELEMLPNRSDSFCDTQDFITQLQKVHDSFVIESWNDALLDIAKQYNLTVPNA